MISMVQNFKSTFLNNKMKDKIGGWNLGKGIGAQMLEVKQTGTKNKGEIIESSQKGVK